VDFCLCNHDEVMLDGDRLLAPLLRVCIAV